ncbi:MAG: sulfotransferase [Pseudomonadales bacterium]
MPPKPKKSNARPVLVPQHGKLRPLSDEQAAAWLISLTHQIPAAALQQGRQVLDQNPASLRFRGAYYQLLCDQEMKTELIDLTREYLKKQPRDALALTYLSHGLRLCGRIPEAISYLEKLYKLNPGDPITLNSLGSAYKAMGDFELAEKFLSRAIAIKPDYGVAYWNKSDISHTQSEDLLNIQKALTGLSDPSNAHYFNFCAYRILERQGEYEQAFAHLKAGNEQKRSNLDYKVEADIAIDEAIRQTFTPEFMQQHAGKGYEGLEPVFIFGMPRSGTTLVEQIVASHPDIIGADELSALGDATREIQRKYRIGGQFPHTLKDLPQGGWQEIGEAYARLTEPMRDGQQRFTDKALLNFKTAGFIRLCLPGAKLVLVERNPMDLGFGCYRQLFSQGLKFSYDFDELARYYASFLKLGNHWENLLGDDLLRIKYEDLVSNPEPEIRRILAHCELSEDPACFTPHKTRRSVRTLSASQVREPISTKSIGRWQQYEIQLQPLQQAFAKHGIKTN